MTTFKIKLFDDSGECVATGNTACFDPTGRTLAAVKQYMAGDYCDWMIQGACYPRQEAASFRARVARTAFFSATIFDRSNRKGV